MIRLCLAWLLYKAGQRLMRAGRALVRLSLRLDPVPLAAKPPRSAG